MGFGSYLVLLLKIVISSSLTLGLLAGVVILLVGETSMNLEIGLEIEAIDGLWVLLGLPVIGVLVFVVISPISFLIYRLLVTRHWIRVA
jgi:hypothetical protein